MARKTSVSAKAQTTTAVPSKPAPATRARSFDEIREALLKRGTHSSHVEEYMRFPFIEYGYRDSKSFSDTFLTLFTFHNETMNIWSHLVGFFCVLIAGYHVAAEMMNTKDLHIFEMIAFETFIVCAALCLLLSAIYHWFGCISEAYHKCLLRVDITGVGLLVAGSYFPAVYYGFYCSPDLQMAHLCLTVLILCVGMAAPWVDAKVNGFEVRPFLLASLVAVGVVPFAQWLYITPDVYRDEVTKEFVLMFLWYGLGFSLYITKLPERCFPNSFIATQVFPSHALWHMCVLGAVYTSFHFYIQYQALLRNHGCSAYHTLVDDAPMVPDMTCDSNGFNGTCSAAGF